MSERQTFRQRLGEIQARNRDTSEAVSRLIADVVEEGERHERGLKRLAMKSDKLAQVGIDLVEHDNRLVAELDAAETEIERAEIRGFRRGLALAIERVRAVGFDL